MQPTKRRIAWFLALVTTITVGAAACSSDSSSTSTSSGSSSGSSAGSSVDYGSLSGTLNGSGSTFQAPFQEVASAAFQENAPNVTINYGGGGSGKGKQDLADQVVDFAGSDSLVKDADVASFKGGQFLYFPTVAAPITVSYTLSGVDKLQLSADTIAKIFQAQVTNWNDPAIAADNPGVTLPSKPITVAHRSDGSGTTSNFTKYLTKAAPSTWTLGAGDTVNWPASTQAGNGNRGVAQIVQTDGGIGYVDYADALGANLKFASIKNAAGKYVAPTLEGTSAAVEQATVAANLTYDPLNAPGETSYPIATPTYMLVYAKQADAAKGAALKGYLNFILTDGQDLAKDANYSALPDSLRDKAVAQLSQITS